MAFSRAPRVPSFIAKEIPFERRTFLLSRPPNSGRVIHFIDHGPRDGRVLWLQHGNPTWSYLWRKVIAELNTERYRVIAPDMLGLGLSSKNLTLEEHRIETHVAALDELFEALKLDRVTLVGQDWGGPLVASLGARHPEAIEGLALLNTSVLVPKRPLGTGFHRFSRLPIVSDLVFRYAGFPLRQLQYVQGDRKSLPRRVARAYRWPLRRIADRNAPLALARMVPSSPTHPSVPELRRGEEWVRSFSGPTALVWGMRDPILARALRRHERVLTHARVVRTDGGHFLQEEVPLEIAQELHALLDAAKPSTR